MAVSVAMLTAAGADVTVKENKSGTPVDFSRNTLVGCFLESDCTHLWFVDDDMGWNPESIIHMIKKDKEFIAGAGPLKTDDEHLFAVKHFTNPDETPVVVDGLIPCSLIGGAFVLLKRSVIEKMLLGYPGLRCAAVHPTQGYTLYEAKYTASSWQGEDYLFCDRWTSLGGEIWLYPDVSFTHTGTKDYKGNYHQFLLGQPQPGGQMQALVAGLNKSIAKAQSAETAEAPKNGLVTAIEKITLCESYINRIAKEVVRIQEQKEVYG